VHVARDAQRHRARAHRAVVARTGARARDGGRAEVVGARVNLCRGDSSLKLVVFVARKAASCAARAHGA